MSIKAQLVREIFRLNEEDAQVLLDSVLLLNQPEPGKQTSMQFTTNTSIEDFISEHGHKITPAVINILLSEPTDKSPAWETVENITEFAFCQRKNAGIGRWLSFQALRKEVLLSEEIE